MSQEVTVRTLPSFEATFVKQVAEAMVKAREAAIISDGNGSDRPTGVLYNANEATAPDKKVEIPKLATGHVTYKTIMAVESLIPAAYDGKDKWFMPKKTFYGTFMSITDDNGQPIARINAGIDGKMKPVLFGRDVVFTDEYMSTYTESAIESDLTFAFVADLSDYIENTSYDLGVQSKIDWDTEDHLTKAVMSVDGKMLIRDSIVKVIKKSS